MFQRPQDLSTITRVLPPRPAHARPLERARSRGALAAALLSLALTAQACGSRSPGLEARVGPCPRETTPTEEADPAVAIKARCMYYEVDGDSPEELRRFMSERGPTDETGTYDGYTSFALHYRYEDVRVNAACQAGPVVVELYLAHILPEWQRGGGAPPDLVVRWRHFTRRLATHEAGHADISVRAANDLARALSALPAFPTCAALREAAHAAFDHAIARLKREHFRYDRRTRHGAAQGGVFP